MMLYPLVTCGFTTYNSEKTIFKALLSALEQDYKNIELLIVDDDSSDLTLNIIHNTLSQKKVRSKVIKHLSNLGVAEARNTLIKNANGDFIAFFDSDDESHRDRVTMQVAKIINYERNYPEKSTTFTNSPLCYSNRLIKFENKKTVICKAMSINKNDYLNKEKIIGSLLFSYPFPSSSDSGSTATCVLCARVKTLKYLNNFNSTLRRFEDLDLVIRAVMKNIPIIRIEKSLVTQNFFETEYKKNEHKYELKLIAIYRSWLQKKGLYKTSLYFVKLRYYLLNLNLIKTLYYLFLIFNENPLLFIKRTFSSLNTFIFTIKIRLMRRK